MIGQAHAYTSADQVKAPTQATTDAFEQNIERFYSLMDRLELMAQPILMQDTPQPDAPVESIPATRLEELVIRFERANRRLENIVSRLQP